MGVEAQYPELLHYLKCPVFNNKKLRYEKKQEKCDPYTGKKKQRLETYFGGAQLLRLSHGMKLEINNRSKTWNEAEAVHRRTLTAVNTYIKEKVLYGLNCAP